MGATVHLRATSSGLKHNAGWQLANLRDTHCESKTNGTEKKTQKETQNTKQNENRPKQATPELESNQQQQQVGGLPKKKKTRESKRGRKDDDPRNVTVADVGKRVTVEGYSCGGVLRFIGSWPTVCSATTQSFPPFVLTVRLSPCFPACIFSLCIDRIEIYPIDAMPSARRPHWHWGMKTDPC